MHWPPMRISPPVTVSRPAIRRSRVDLPQPDGPSSATNSPGAITLLFSIRDRLLVWQKGTVKW